MTVVSWVLHICTIVALLTTLALALTLVVRSCELFKQSQAGVCIQQFEATKDLREGDLVSELDGVLFPLQRTSSPTTVTVEEPCKSQRLHSNHLVQITESKFFAPNKGETGLVLSVRKFERGSFLDAKTQQSVPRALCSSRLAIHCTAFHVVVCSASTVAVFPCDWATSTLQPWTVVATDCPIADGVASACTSKDSLELSLTLTTGATLHFEKNAWVQRDVRHAWALRKHRASWSLHQNSLVSELPRDVEQAVLCAPLLFLVVNTGSVYCKKLDDAGAWSKPQCLLEANQRGTRIVASCTSAVLVCLAHSSVLIHVTPDGITKLTVAASVPECDDMLVLNPKNGSLLVALKNPQGVSLFGHVPRWTMQPSSTFLGLVAKRNKKVAFVVRKGPVPIKKFIPEEVGSSGMLVLNTKTNTVIKQAKITGPDFQTCARFSGKTLELEC